MHAISRRKIREFIEDHPDAEASLTAWWNVIKQATWRTLADAKQEWSSSTDYDEGLTVFNISGNKYRLIAFIDYDAQVVLVRAVLTHKEYDSNEWKRDTYYRG